MATYQITINEKMVLVKSTLNEVRFDEGRENKGKNSTGISRRVTQRETKRKMNYTIVTTKDFESSFKRLSKKISFII
jgi:hypothetical protein